MDTGTRARLWEAVRSAGDSLELAKLCGEDLVSYADDMTAQVHSPEDIVRLLTRRWAEVQDLLREAAVSRSVV